MTQTVIQRKEAQAERNHYRRARSRFEMRDESIGRTGKHSEFCEGEVSCPDTGKDECGKEMNWMIDSRGRKIACVTVLCFGCRKPHNVGVDVQL